MNLRLIEAQKAKKEEQEKLEARRKEQLEEVMRQAKKLSDMQRDINQQWIVHSSSEYEAYTHSDVQWTQTLNPIRGITGNAVYLDDLTPLPATAGSGEFLRYYNSIISRTITEIINFNSGNRFGLRSIAEITNQIERAMMNLQRQHILYNYNILFDNRNTLIVRWRFEIDSAEFMEQRILG